MLSKNQFGDKMFDYVNYTLLAIIILVVAYPLYYVVIASISDPELALAGKVWLYPRGITFDAYKNVIKNEIIWIGYKNSLIYTVLGTFINLFFTITCAFALSRKHLKGRNLFMGIFVFTMYFGGGLIPFYILMKNLHLLNTIWAMTLPGAMSVYYMIVCRTYYANNIPEELYESAKIDGSNYFGMFFRIALPLSTPIIAVMALFYGVGHWNAFFNALIFITKERLFPLQLILRNILMMNQMLNMELGSMPNEQMEYVAKQAMMAEAMKFSLIIIASLPVLMIYPLVQKYFVKGIMIGAIKG